VAHCACAPSQPASQPASLPAYFLPAFNLPQQAHAFACLSPRATPRAHSPARALACPHAHTPALTSPTARTHARAPHGFPPSAVSGVQIRVLARTGGVECRARKRGPERR
jgi:hypothetical protein